MHDAREYDAIVSTGEQVTSGALIHRVAGPWRAGAVLDRLADSDHHQRCSR